MGTSYQDRGEIREVITQEQLDFLNDEFFPACDEEHEKLSDWSAGFVRNMQERVEKFEIRTNISLKQGAQIKRIWVEELGKGEELEGYSKGEDNDGPGF